jgi:hypothetical protein
MIATVSLRLLYLLFLQVLGLVVLLGRTASSKRVGLLVLRHEPGCHPFPDADEHPSGRSALVHLADRRGGLLQRENRADWRVDHAGLHQRQEVAPLLADVHRLGLPELLRGSSHHSGVDQQQPIDLDRGDLPAGEAEDDQPALAGQGA